MSLPPPPPQNQMVPDASYDLGMPDPEATDPFSADEGDGRTTHAMETSREDDEFDKLQQSRCGLYEWITYSAITISILASVISTIPLILIASPELAASAGLQFNGNLESGSESDASPDILRTYHQIQVYATRPNHIYEYDEPVLEADTFGEDNTAITHHVGMSVLGWTYQNWWDFAPSYQAGLSEWEYRQLYPYSELVVHYGDRLVFRNMRDGSWPDDNCWLVPKEIYDSCNFSAGGYADYYLDGDGNANLTSSLLLFERDAVYTNLSAPENANLSYTDFTGWNQLVWDISDNSHVLPCADNDLWCQLVTADTLYFVSMSYWNVDWWNGTCKGDFGRGGAKQEVRVIPRTRTSIPVMEAMHDLDPKLVQDLTYSIGVLGRTLIVSQFNAEERLRSEGQSGLTNTRGHTDGDAAYDDGTYTNGATASIHDHADNILVVGIGEIEAVLNGVEFRTRHNDYNLNMPSRDSGDYNAVEPVPLPAVPPAVLNAGNASAQVEEMIEWFRAFKEQNASHRNYPAYFQPILCYLEGTWIVDDEQLEEPFDSDRHHIDARSWQELHDKIRWMANSGRKDVDENLAHLPSSIRNLLNETYPIVSNWEYRIVCHPLQNDVATSRLQVEDDLSVQLMGAPETRQELLYSRRARFQLNTHIDVDEPDDDRWVAGRKQWNYLDYLMEQIPGKDNYRANLSDAFPDGTEEAIHFMTDAVLNSGYYSRFYGLMANDAMGSSKHRRGYSDRFLFAAKNSQPKVSPVAFEYEVRDEETGDVVDRVATVSRWSYAIPLEIIYTTPLSTWNPHNISFIDRDVFDYDRDGSCTDATAFGGWTIDRAYFTPAQLFAGFADSSTADTAASNVCSRLADGRVVEIAASGHWVTFPDVAGGVGPVRQRYPIFPIHNAGSPAFKEVKALQAVTLPQDYDDPILNPDGFFGDSRDLNFGFELNLEGGGHSHVCFVDAWRVGHYWLLNAETIEWCTSPDCYIEANCDTREGHQHYVRVWRDLAADGATWVYHLRDCRYGTDSDSDIWPYPQGWTTLNVNGDAVCTDLHNVLER